MKGLVAPKNPNTIYLVVKHGCLCQESKTMRDGYDPIEVVNPSTGETFFKYIKEWAGVEAMVTDITFRDEVFDGVPYLSWRISLQADGPPMVLELPLNSSVGDRFTKTAESIDFSKPVEFRAWRERESKKTAFMIAQGEQNVPQLYTKENPGDLPPATQRFDRTWDFGAQKEFLYRRMMEVVIPRVHAANGIKPESPVEPNADPFAKSESAPESPSTAPATAASGDDPFSKPKPAPAPAVQSQPVTSGTAGPISEATLATLVEMAGKRPDLDFNQLAQNTFHRPGVRDLTEGQSIALMKLVENL